MINRKESFTWRSRGMRQICPASTLILRLGATLYMLSKEVQVDEAMQMQMQIFFSRSL
jgi:hypothetical protein